MSANTLCLLVWCIRHLVDGWGWQSACSTRCDRENGPPEPHSVIKSEPLLLVVGQCHQARETRRKSSRRILELASGLTIGGTEAEPLGRYSDAWHGVGYGPDSSGFVVLMPPGAGVSFWGQAVILLSAMR